MSRKKVGTKELFSYHSKIRLTGTDQTSESDLSTNHYDEETNAALQRKWTVLRIGTGGWRVISATTVFMRLLICTHQLKYNSLLS